MSAGICCIIPVGITEFSENYLEYTKSHNALRPCPHRHVRPAGALPHQIAMPEYCATGTGFFLMLSCLFFLSPRSGPEAVPPCARGGVHWNGFSLLG
jgi:hypothetical protein